MQDVAIVALAAIAAFLLWNRTGTRYDEDAAQTVSPDVIQTIIESLQKDDRDLEPIETVFIKPRTDNTGSMFYDARFLFLNTRGYFGVQFDISARVNQDGSLRIVSKNNASGIDRSGPFNPYTADKYLPFPEVEASLDKQLNSLLDESRGKS
jgi:hypothetical protein